MPVSNAIRRGLVASLAALAANGASVAQDAVRPIRFDNWGYFQRNADGSNTWTYRPRVFVPFDLESTWAPMVRVDIPMNYTNATGPGNPDGGYSGGIGNIMIEPIVDSPEVAPNLTLRASLRLVFPSPKPQPFGKDDQYQLAPGVGFTYRLPDVLNGVTIGPYLRYFWGFDAQSPGTTLVSSLNLFPTVTFGLNERWSLVFYPENPITYNRNNGSWFVPLDFLFVNRVSKTFEFAIGGAVKLGNPSNPSYDYIVDGRATFFF